MSALLLDRYKDKIAQGFLEPDPAQVEVLGRLDDLRERLEGYRLPRRSTPLGWLLGKKPTPGPRGLYVWGPVGRGKTMIMDLFFETVAVEHKHRLHFNEFMAGIHARIHAWRQDLKKGLVKGDDPIEPVAQVVAETTALLCFDEFTVTDIADAMILGRLFEALFARGVVIVATSNVAPGDLYTNGLNRALFLPFIRLIEERMEPVRLVARTDYRLEKLQGQPVYYVPADARADLAMTKAFKALTGVEQGDPISLELLGRSLRVPQAKAHVARFDFTDLCDAPLGSTDFLAIATNFHSVLIDRIPIIASDRRNSAKRFILLIDALYDQHVKLIASAAAQPIDLYFAERGTEAFEFDRTVSRLIEMQSSSYLALPHGTIDSQASGVSTGLVET
ncbi:cell division protein ZapE [Beijerinckia indica]|uniref:AFG1-family ATPase n=1 Tax=Beijerinckia indica subsp. indica (strain ATCC 9039 / DSM 1715 / NCIMB 8712) TaxID=395963 RepID=B2IG83_BEII9|nr:cell division protein ZapE [Beijerinckia indica]ACB97157.1 AFG1-family ATPase [Beijerinckia indica subsp. indica ATCC 9039]